jgi:hypothetical protein
VGYVWNRIIAFLFARKFFHIMRRGYVGHTMGVNRPINVAVLIRRSGTSLQNLIDQIARGAQCEDRYCNRIASRSAGDWLARAPTR